MLIPLVAILLAQPVPPRPQVADEGVVLGRPDRINFIGAGVTCTGNNTLVSCTIPGGGGGGGGSPGGSSGNLQINSSGTFGAYGGSSCAAGRFASSTNANGTWTCAQVAWANLSGVPTTFTPSAHTHGASDLTGGTSAQFLRGDNTWANALIGPLDVQGDVTNSTGQLKLYGNTVSGTATVIGTTQVWAPADLTAAASGDVMIRYRMRRPVNLAALGGGSFNSDAAIGVETVAYDDGVAPRALRTITLEPEATDTGGFAFWHKQTGGWGNKAVLTFGSVRPYAWDEFGVFSKKVAVPTPQVDLEIFTTVSSGDGPPYPYFRFYGDLTGSAAEILRFTADHRLRLTSTASTNEPDVAGDFWWDGTNLRFYDGASRRVNEWADLTNVPATFTPSTHTHGASSMTGGTNAQFLRGDGSWSSTLNGTLTLSGIASSGDLSIVPGTSSLITMGTYGSNQTIQATVPLALSKHVAFSNGPPSVPATGNLWSDGQWLKFLHGGVSGLGRPAIINEWADLTNVPASFPPSAHTHALSSVTNPTGDWTATFPSGTKALWTFTGSTDNAFSIHGDGAFTGSGDLVHIHKTGTGSTAGADALHVEVDTDTNMTGVRVTMANSTRTGITTNAAMSAASLSLTTPLPGASGGVGVALPTCSGTDKLTADGTQVSCAADQTGSGAPAAATYIVQTADAGLSNEQVLASLATGILKNTTTTGVLSIAAAGTDYGPPTSGNATGLVLSTTGTGAHTAYAGTSCTNQFPRSLNASGAATCASVDLSADTAATLLPIAKGGTNSSATATNGGIGYGTGTAHAYTAAGTAGQVPRSAGAGAPVWVGVQTCTSSASTTCTITVARSGCTPVCSQTTSVSAYLSRASVSGTTLTCTFPTSGTNTCACFCP